MHGRLLFPVMARLPINPAAPERVNMVGSDAKVVCIR